MIFNLLWMNMARAFTVRGRIVTDSPLLSDLSSVSPETKALLNGGIAGRGLIQVDGTFELVDVPTGQYVLSIMSRDFIFPTFALDVDAEKDVVTVKPHRTTFLPLSNAPSLPHPVIFRPTIKPEYFDIKQGWNLKGLIMGNPMMLLMVVGVGMMFLLPKLLAMIDPEALAEVQANQRRSQENMSKIQNMDFNDSVSKFLSGSTDSRPATTSSRVNGAGSSQARKRK